MNLIDYSKVLVESNQVLEKCFKKYKINEVFVAFNGGKDCTVLLDMISRVLKNNQISNMELLHFVYIKSDNPFPELEEFIYNVERLYKLKLTVIRGDIRLVLNKMISEDPNIKACLMGTRRSDPYSEDLDFFQMTDHNWPQIMRVSPLLDWSYHEIWSYLIDKKVPCCSLYYKGYTSLGNVHNTIPNPSLKVTDPTTGIVTYKPAYFLEDGSLERSGRITSKGGN